MSTTCTGERSAHPHLRCLACHRRNPAPPAALHTFPSKQQRSAPTHATQVWATVHSTAASLRRAAIAWDLLYLGRNRHGSDGPTVCDAPAAGRRNGAARVVRAGARLAVVDLAAHGREELRDAHAHARLGFTDAQMAALFSEAGFAPDAPITVPGGELTVKIWTGTRLSAPSFNPKVSL